MSGDFGVAAGALQLVVPSYGLRLVRRFGTHRVGWFLVTAFCSLAALHLLESMRPANWGVAPDLMLNLVYAVGSVLLLIGMGHIDSFFTQTERSRTSEEMLSSHWEAQIRKETAGLAKANEALQLELAHRKHAEAALRESEAQYRFVFLENPLPMWILDLRECRFLAVNKAATSHYGYTAEEFMQLAPQNLLPPEQAQSFIEEISKAYSRMESRGRWSHYRKDRSLAEVEVAVRDFSYAGVPARLAVIEDVTQQRLNENERFQAGKMELACRMAGGVAYHFNDILGAIENHTSALRQKTQDPASAAHLQNLTLATNRGSNLAYQLLAASGQQNMRPRPLDVNRLTMNLSLVLRRIVGDKGILQIVCGLTPLPVMADAQVVEHILMTLVKNATEAIPERGTIAVSTTVVHAPKQNDEQTTEFVRISVRDNGCGMSPDIQEHLFEPFFTTKQPAGGIGLGLAGVYGATRQLGGWVECLSTEESGTEIRVCLPCVPEAALTSDTEMRAATAVIRGTILVVDPDDRSRAVARYVLNRHGYRVVEADSCALAQMLWDGQARNIDLVLTDVTLPESSGFDLINGLRQKRSDLKVAYACTEDELKQLKPALSEDAIVISKPYHSEKLMEMVETVCKKGRV